MAPVHKIFLMSKSLDVFLAVWMRFFVVLFYFLNLTSPIFLLLLELL